MNDFDEGPLKVFLLIVIVIAICACLILSSAGNMLLPL